MDGGAAGYGEEEEEEEGVGLVRGGWEYAINEILLLLFFFFQCLLRPLAPVSKAPWVVRLLQPSEKPGVQVL